MASSKAQDKVFEVANPLCFVWFSAHRLVVVYKRVNMGDDVARWPDRRLFEPHLGFLGGPLETPKMVSKGETSRHQGYSHTVFYRSKRPSCYFEAKFCHEVRCRLVDVDAHFILFFTHQDAHSARCGSGGFRLPRVSFIRRWLRIGADRLQEAHDTVLVSLMRCSVARRLGRCRRLADSSKKNEEKCTSMMLIFVSSPYKHSSHSRRFAKKREIPS